MKSELSFSDPRTIADFARWAGLTMVVAAPSALLGLFMHSRDPFSAAVIVASVAGMAAGFAASAVVASRLGIPAIDRILAALRSALWIKAALAAMLVGIVVDIFGGAQGIQALQWLINAAALRNFMSENSIGGTFVLCAMEGAVVFGQVVVIATVLFVVKFDPQIGRRIARCLRSVAARMAA